jgi:hypothetical protein
MQHVVSHSALADLRKATRIARNMMRGQDGGNERCTPSSEEEDEDGHADRLDGRQSPGATLGRPTSTPDFETGRVSEHKREGETNTGRHENSSLFFFFLKG